MWYFSPILLFLKPLDQDIPSIKQFFIRLNVIFCLFNSAQRDSYLKECFLTDHFIFAPDINTNVLDDPLDK